MKNALILSLIIHAILIALLVWSDELQLEYFKSKKIMKDASTALEISGLPYKPSDSALRLGREKRDLPPPDIKVPERQPDAPVVKEKQTPKVKEKKTPDDKKKISEKREVANAKQSMKSILDKLRNDAKKEDRPPPKIDNFPTHEKGEVGGRGTGGRGKRLLSPAEQALQSAMRRHFDLVDARTFRKVNPNAEGYIEVSLVGVGNQFRIKTLRILESTGIKALDQSCERAIRVAIDDETFAMDVIRELSGKDSAILCQP